MLSPELAPPTTARVLVVDDDEAVRSVLAQILEDEGFDVVGAAADGLEAIAIAERLRPDAVVLDVRMPGLDGIEVARRIRPIDARMRLVMLSAYDDATLQREAVDAGANTFLIKGCPLSELVDAMTG